MRSRKSCRLGFTLVELLAVAGAVSLMGTQILDAIVQAREASRRSECKINLKQIGLALHNYHEVYGGLPPGWVGVNNEDKEPQVFGLNGFGWAARLTPFIDQAPLYNTFNMSASITDKENAKVIDKTFPPLRCPSDPFSKRIWAMQDSAGKAVADVGVSNYPGSFGTDDFSKCEKMKPGEVCKGNGIFFHNSFIRFRDVTDGSANTIAVGERVLNEKTDQLTTWTGVFPTATSPFSRILGTSEQQLGVKDKNVAGYTSAHKDGVHMLMLDGAVQFRENKLDLKVLQALTTRDGGEEIPEE
jgi:type II secretory pathway pseudopilin PulG